MALKATLAMAILNHSNAAPGALAGMVCVLRKVAGGPIRPCGEGWLVHRLPMVGP